MMYECTRMILLESVTRCALLEPSTHEKQQPWTAVAAKAAPWQLGLAAATAPVVGVTVQSEVQQVAIILEKFLLAAALGAWMHILAETNNPA
jgi:hypothetical protein